VKILIIRTIQSDLLAAFLNSLHDSYPQAQLYLLDNRKQAAFSKAQQHIEPEIFWTRKAGDYSITNITLQTLRAIRKHKFDQVIIPHKQAGITGLENVVQLLYLLQGQEWLHCSIDWRLRKIPRSQILKMLGYTLLTVPLFILTLPVLLLSFSYLWLLEPPSRPPDRDLV